MWEVTVIYYMNKLHKVKINLESKMQSNKTSNKKVKKEEPKRIVSDNEIEEYFKHAIAKAYIDICEDIELAFYDEPEGGIVKADAVYYDEVLATIYLNLYTGEITMDRYDQ